MHDGNLEANFPSSSYQIFHAEGPRDSGRGGRGNAGVGGTPALKECRALLIPESGR